MAKKEEIICRKPMLAPNDMPTEEQLEKHWPLFASPKLDGIRCLMGPGQFVRSRSWKPFPNAKLLPYFKGVLDYCSEVGVVLDGELWSDAVTFQEISPRVMTKNDPPSPEPLIYHVFDMLTVAQWNGAEEVPPFVDRIDALIKAVQAIHSIAYTPVAAIWQANVDSYKQVKDLFDYQIAAGGEGLVLRDPKGLYKHGRCTLKEGNIFKFKLFEWIDAEVIAVNQLFTSFEDAEDDAFGHTKKSQKKADLRPIAMMGSLTVRTADGMEFNTGSGFTDAERTQLWKDRNNVLGRWCSVKHQPAGAKDLPRLPIFERWRPDLP